MTFLVAWQHLQFSIALVGASHSLLVSGPQNITDSTLLKSHHFFITCIESFTKERSQTMCVSHCVFSNTVLYGTLDYSRMRLKKTGRRRDYQCVSAQLNDTIDM